MSEAESLNWRPGEPLQLETERFLLRSLTPADATITYVRWWNDPLRAPIYGRNSGRQAVEQPLCSD